MACLNVVTSTTAYSDPFAPSYMAPLVLELAVYFFDQRGRSWSFAEFRRECISLFGLPVGAKSEVHHLIAQHLVKGIEVHRAGDEHWETYANLMNCPYLGMPLTTDEHRGPDSVHAAVKDQAKDYGVDLSDGLYRGLSKLAPHDYLEISLAGFQNAHPGMYRVWVHVVGLAYDALS